MNRLYIGMLLVLVSGRAWAMEEGNSSDIAIEMETVGQQTEKEGKQEEDKAHSSVDTLPQGYRFNPNYTPSTLQDPTPTFAIMPAPVSAFFRDIKKKLPEVSVSSMSCFQKEQRIIDEGELLKKLNLKSSEFQEILKSLPTDKFNTLAYSIEQKRIEGESPAQIYTLKEFCAHLLHKTNDYRTMVWVQGSMLAGSFLCITAALVYIRNYLG
jgi:hypothetical protein